MKRCFPKKRYSKYFYFHEKKSFKRKQHLQYRNYEHERISLYNIKSEYLRDSIKYMFYANGGAIAWFIVKLDIKEFYISLLAFSIGASYSLMIPIFMYFKTKYVLYDSIKNMTSPLNHENVHPIIDKFLRLVIFFMVYFPMICFIVGVFNAFEIYSNSK